MKMAQVEEFTARAYQIDLYEKALTENTIIYLPTGSGKTYIVVMVIEKMSEDVRIPWNEGGKRTVFLVNTVPLVKQQCEYISRHSNLICSGYSGDMNVDLWNNDMWTEEFCKNQVLVMTSQILLDILNHGFLPLTRINLIIFDECHHAVGDHPMRSIMKRFEDYPPDLQPKVLGTSATLLNSNVKIENVEKNIRELEITLHAKVITVDSINPVQKYGKPNEYVVYYKLPDESRINSKLDECVDYIKEVLDMVDFFELPSESSKVFQPRSKSTKIKCIFDEIQEFYKTQGLYMAFKAILYHMVKLEQMKRYIDDVRAIIVIDFLITDLTMMRKIIADEMIGGSELEIMDTYSSEQLQRLFAIIRKFYCLSLSNDGKFCCIIFVRRRFTAKVLYQVLKRRSQSDSQFKFLIPQYVIGNSADPLKTPYESLCLQKWTEEALIKFRTGAVNCLISTDVLDEGIDIPLCSLVIRYDMPQDFRAYVQSKGRGRDKNSNYILLTDDSEQFRKKLAAYHHVEMTLSTKLVGNSAERIKPLPDELKEHLYETAIQPFSVINSTGIQSSITEVSAIGLLNQYCSSLNRSKFVNNAPTWTLHKINRENSTENYFMVTLSLPMAAPLRQTISSDLMPSILLAKRSAAMKACMKLYEIGELTDNLLPKTSNRIVEDITTLLVHWQEEDREGKKKVGTPFNKRPYGIVYPQALYAASPVPDQLCYLHVISTKPTYPVPTENRNWAFYNIISERAGYAILSSKKFPKIPNFPIYMNAGPVEITIDVNASTVNLTHDEIIKLRQFHWVIFKEVLELIKDFMIFDDANKENSYLIVPVDQKLNIDWDTVHRYPSIRRETAQNRSMRAITNDTKPISDIAEDAWELVAPNYRSSTGMYVVTKVCDELTPKSAFPTEDFLSYIHYFRKKHSLQITDEEQPLLEVKAISRNINCIKPRNYEPTTNKRKRSNLEEHLVPELCYKVIFPALYWLKATLLPSILHRVSQLLIADDLRREIVSKTKLGIENITINSNWPPFEFHQYDSNENVDVCSQMDTIYDESNPLDNCKSDLIPISPDIDVSSLDSTIYPWPKDQEPCDLERNVEDVQLIDIDYYHQFIKSFGDMNSCRIKSKFEMKGYAVKADVTAPRLKVLERTSSIGPTPADIVLALTPKFASDTFNLERLETLGDSYLKFIISIYLFETFPTYNEGSLTSAKGNIIGNRYLYYCGKNKNIPGRLKVDNFEPTSNFIVPSYCAPRQLQKAVQSLNKSPNVLYEIAIPVNEQFQGKLSAASEIKFLAQIESWVDAKNTTGVEQFVGFQVVPDKTVSDSVESLTGVYLNSMGLVGAAKLLQWFGTLPNNVKIYKILDGKPDSPRLGPGSINEHNLSANYVENALGYKFSDRAFLLQAFTHPSYTPNRITNSYERLEFLGDAIIDFLITVYIYENCGDLSPGALTDLRSALVNNITFACLTVKYGLHTALLSYSPLLSDAIMRFVKYQEERGHLINDELLWILLEEDECNMAEYVDVPKILGDLFESVIAAIYLDSGKNLTTVWNIIYGLMHREIGSFSRNIPKQPVRVIYETQGANPKFLPSETIGNSNIVMVPLEVYIFGKKKLFHGFGTSQKQARAAAAKQALKSLRQI